MSSTTFAPNTVTTSHTSPAKKYPTRGFGGMDPEKRKEIASKGGKSAHALGRAHKWTKEEAQQAGKKGGTISRRTKYATQPE